MSTDTLIPTLLAASNIATVTVTGVYLLRLRHRLNDAIWQANHDPLTGVHNRRVLTPAVAHKTTTGRPFAIALLDIDRFKTINDLFGHTTGDHVLTELTRRLTHLDPRISHLIRLGGDEFALLIDADTDSSLAVAKAAWRTIAATPFPVAHTHADTSAISVNISVGVAGHTLGTDTAALLRQADHALTAAKATGTVIRAHPGPAPPVPPRRRPRCARDRAETVPPPASDISDPPAGRG
jgi:two-component system cell cycle response regulator